MYNEFEKRNLHVVAIAQEDKQLESHARLPARLPDGYEFDIVADLNHEHTQQYDRVTTYYITRDGVVRQVFPQLIHHRAAWWAILNEVDRIRALTDAEGG